MSEPSELESAKENIICNCSDSDLIDKEIRRSVDEYGLAVFEIVERPLIISGLARKWTLLTAFSCRGDYHAVMSCLDSGASPSETTDEGETPLFMACKMGNRDCVRLLLRRGCLTSAGNMAPLLEACKGRTRNHASCILLLLGSGASLGERTKTVSGNYLSPLDIAIINCSEPCLLQLLKLGADLKQISVPISQKYRDGYRTESPKIAHSLGPLARGDRQTAINILEGCYDHLTSLRK